MAFTCFRYHIVTATHKRRRMIDAQVEAIIDATLRRRALELDGQVLHMGGVADHIHFITSIPSTITVSDFIGSLKAETSRIINRQRVLPEDFAWQRSFGAFTCDPHNMDRIIKYVENQKQHHAAKDIWPDYEKTRSHKDPDPQPR